MLALMVDAGGVIRPLVLYVRQKNVFVKISGVVNLEMIPV